MRSLGLFLLLAAPSVAQPSEPTPGFQFLGFGYDAFSGNPLATGMGDLGYRTNIVTFTYKGNKKTTDRRWSVPDKTTSQAMYTCNEEQISQIVDSGSEYNKQVKTSVDVSGSFINVTAALSSDSKHVRDTTENKESIFTQVTSLCTVYKLTMHTYDLPDVDTNFLKGVESLPDSYDEEPYMNFIKHFGTHVVTAMELGGRWGWQAEFHLDDWQSMLDDGVDIGASISYAGKFKAGLKINNSVDTRTVSRVTSSISKNSTFSIGGEFTPDMDAWMASVSASPMPVHITLTELTDLFTDSFLPKVDNLDVKKANLQNASLNYCLYLESPDGSDYCNAPVPIPMPTPSPDRRDVIRGICVENGGGYVMDFDMFISGTTIQAHSDDFPIGQTKCIDAEAYADEGDVLKCRIHISGGVSRTCPGSGYKFSSAAKLKSCYKCWGTTLFPTCQYMGLTQDCGGSTEESFARLPAAKADPFSNMFSSAPGTAKRVQRLAESLENLIV